MNPSKLLRNPKVVTLLCIFAVVYMYFNLVHPLIFSSDKRGSKSSKPSHKSEKVAEPVETILEESQDSEGPGMPEIRGDSLQKAQNRSWMTNVYRAVRDPFLPSGKQKHTKNRIQNPENVFKDNKKTNSPLTPSPLKKLVMKKPRRKIIGSRNLAYQKNYKKKSIGARKNPINTRVNDTLEIDSLIIDAIALGPVGKYVLIERIFYSENESCPLGLILKITREFVLVEQVNGKIIRLNIVEKKRLADDSYYF